MNIADFLDAELGGEIASRLLERLQETSPDAKKLTHRDILNMAAASLAELLVDSEEYEQSLDDKLIPPAAKSFRERAAYRKDLESDNEEISEHLEEIGDNWVQVRNFKLLNEAFNNPDSDSFASRTERLDVLTKGESIMRKAAPIIKRANQDPDLSHMLKEVAQDYATRLGQSPE